MHFGFLKDAEGNVIEENTFYVLFYWLFFHKICGNSNDNVLR